MSSDEQQPYNPYEIPANPMTLENPADTEFAGRELRQISRWQRVFAAIGFVMTVFMTGVFIVATVSGITGPRFGIGATEVVILVVSIAFYGVPSFFLWRAAMAAKVCSTTGQPQDLIRFIKTQAAFWRLIGILFVLFILVYLSIVVGASLLFSL